MHVPRKPMSVGGAGSNSNSSKQPATKPVASPAPDDARHANVTCFRATKCSHRCWLADSSASHHITPERALLHDFRPVNQPVQIVLGKSTVRLVAYGLGTVHLTSDNGQPFTLRDVLCAPDATANHLSTVVADQAGWRVVQEGGGLDDFSRLSVVVCLKAKSKVPEAIKATVQWLETQSGRRLKALRSDKGSEFVDGEMDGMTKAPPRVKFEFCKAGMGMV
ncbi:hypothetical protein QJQ45_006777 [Haematococcus lacustris]|nr:hypothetical protein QJQ45_006777 [Haematococcus lacustris]